MFWRKNNRWILITVFGLVIPALLLLLARPVLNSGQGLKEYVVKESRHDFKPNKIPLPIIGIRAYEVVLKFDSTCWWGIEDVDYDHGVDIRDWNKISGATNFFSASNKQSALLGWRPSKVYNKIEVTAYTNARDGTFRTGPVITVPVDSQLVLGFKWEKDSVVYQYAGVVHAEALKRPFLVREVGPWFGGNQKAHRRIWLLLKSHVM